MVIKISNKQGFHYLLTTFLILTIFLTLLVNAGSAQKEGSVAYVYISDRSSLEKYEAILSVDFDVYNFSIEEEEHIDFSEYDVIIIGSDLNFDNNAYKTVREDTTDSEKPILALGLGGTSYLNSLYNMDLNLSSTKAVGIYPEGDVRQHFNKARSIDMSTTAVLPLYHEPGSEWIVANLILENITPFGRSSDGSGLYPMAFERNDEKSGEIRWFLWGFTDSPHNLTYQGSNLFVNVVTEMTRRSSVIPSIIPSEDIEPLGRILTIIIGFILFVSGLIITVLTTLKKDITIEVGFSERNVKYVGGAGILLILIGVGLILISSNLVPIKIVGLI